jgi:hypothetical protein
MNIGYRIFFTLLAFSTTRTVFGGGGGLESGQSAPVFVLVCGHFVTDLIELQARMPFS